MFFTSIFFYHVLVHQYVSLSLYCNLNHMLLHTVSMFFSSKFYIYFCSYICESTIQIFYEIKIVFFFDKKNKTIFAKYFEMCYTNIKMLKCYAITKTSLLVRQTLCLPCYYGLWHTFHSTTETENFLNVSAS